MKPRKSRKPLSWRKRWRISQHQLALALSQSDSLLTASEALRASLTRSEQERRDTQKKLMELQADVDKLCWNRVEDRPDLDQLMVTSAIPQREIAKMLAPRQVIREFLIQRFMTFLSQVLKI